MNEFYDFDEIVLNNFLFKHFYQMVFENITILFEQTMLAFPLFIGLFVQLVGNPHKEYVNLAK